MSQLGRTQDMMIEAYEKRQVLSKMTLLVLSNGKKNYCMTNGEYKLVQNFAMILKLFCKATQYLCQVNVVKAT